MSVTEGALTIEIPAGCSVVKFDGPSHGLSHCMKAVDFVVETPGRILFIELKDPEDGPQDRRAEFIERLTSGQIDNDLRQKFRDTWLYLYADGKLNKPVNYLVLIGLSTLSSETLARRTRNLMKQLPVEGPRGPWTNKIVEGCAVHNIASWNATFASFSVTRA